MATTIHTETLYKIREFRANGKVFSTFGSYDDLGNEFYGALFALEMAERTAREMSNGHTFNIIKQVTKTKEHLILD